MGIFLNEDSDGEDETSWLSYAIAIIFFLAIISLLWGNDILGAIEQFDSPDMYDPPTLVQLGNYALPFFLSPSPIR